MQIFSFHPNCSTFSIEHPYKVLQKRSIGIFLIFIFRRDICNYLFKNGENWLQMAKIGLKMTLGPFFGAKNGNKENSNGSFLKDLIEMLYTKYPIIWIKIEDLHTLFVEKLLPQMLTILPKI